MKTAILDDYQGIRAVRGDRRHARAHAVPQSPARAPAEPRAARHDRDGQREHRCRRRPRARHHGVRHGRPGQPDRRAHLGADPRARAAHPGRGRGDPRQRVAAHDRPRARGPHAVDAGLGRLGARVARIGQAFGILKPTAYFVNTSRGPIVDEPALVKALHEGTIAGAALDVYETEPLPPEHPLRSAPNTVLTPHIGYVTTGSYEVFYRDAAEDIAAFLRGEPVRVLDA